MATYRVSIRLTLMGIWYACLPWLANRAPYGLVAVRSAGGKSFSIFF